MSSQTIKVEVTGGKVWFENRQTVIIPTYTAQEDATESVPNLRHRN